MNDGVCDPAGRFWVGSMTYDGHWGMGSLYRVDADGSVHKVWGGLSVPNGPAFHPDGHTIYLADSARGEIWTAEVDVPTGQLHDRRLFATVEDGSPDGMTVDQDGHLWVAVWGAGRVQAHHPDGRVVRRIELGCEQPTAPCLVGDGPEARMVITSARHGLTRPGPTDGSVLVVASGTAGFSAREYVPEDA